MRTPGIYVPLVVQERVDIVAQQLTVTNEETGELR